MTWVLAALLVIVAVWLPYRAWRNLSIERPPLLDAAGRPYDHVMVGLSDGESVPLIDTGDGPAVLLLPGADGIRETWRYQVPELARRYRVLAPNLRRRVPPGATFARFGRDVEEILDARGVEEAVVVGQSLGGSIAMSVAAERPERVRAVVIANSLARLRYDHVGLNRTLLVPVAMATTRYLPTALARAFARLWSRLGVWVFDASPGAERVIDYVLWTGPRTVSPRVSNARVDLLKGEDLRPGLARIHVPALIVKGPRDSYVPVAWSRDIADRIPGSRYVEIPETGHCSHISMPDIFNRMLSDWLAGVDDQRPSKEADT